MKQLLFLLTVLITTSQINFANAQTTSASASNKRAAMRPMANEGDSVWVIINHIKADKRQQFEKFVHEIFWPMAKKLTSEEQRVFRQTRVLHSVKPEEDGTYSYLFIMDPVVPGADYDIENLLKKMYDEQKATEYMKMLNETEASGQTGYRMLQSRH